MSRKRPIVVPPMDTTPEKLAKMVLRHRPAGPEVGFEETPAEFESDDEEDAGDA